MSEYRLRKVIEYWVSQGREDGLESGEDLYIIEGKHWRRAKALIGDPDVHYIERVTSWVDDCDSVEDREYEDVWVRGEEE
tara:strand:+ start:820 stop:1059 length:240 start_codon:yes stop_codon:yes gene_type:complete